MEDRDRKHFGWLRHLLLMSSGLFGILISLHRSDVGNLPAHLLFSLAILTLGLGILCGSIALYVEVYVGKRLFRLWKERIQNMIAGKDPGAGVFVDAPKIFQTIEKGCYVFLCSSVLLLMVYTLLR